MKVISPEDAERLWTAIREVVKTFNRVEAAAQKEDLYDLATISFANELSVLSGMVADLRRTATDVLAPLVAAPNELSVQEVDKL